MKNSFPTLEQIREIIKAEGKIVLAAYDRDTKILEGKINSVENKLDSHVEQNEKDFSDLHNTIQDLLGGIDKSADQKITRHCEKYHSMVA